MDLARRPLSDTMALSKKRDRFNAQSLGVPLNDNVKKVRKLHPNPIFERPFPTSIVLYVLQPLTNESKGYVGASAFSP